MAGLYGYTSSMMQNTLDKEYENYSNNLESYLQDILLPFIISNDKESINGVLNSVIKLDVIESIKLLAFDEIVFDHDKKRLPEGAAEDIELYQLESIFTVSNMQVGALKANLYLKERDERSKQTLHTLLFASAIATFFIITAILLFLFSIKKKLSQFETATRSITNNHIPEKIPVVGKDEFSTLAKTFNAMLWQLREKYVALDMSPDGILIVNDSGKITYINSALTQLFSIGSPSSTFSSLADFDEILLSKLNFKESSIKSLKGNFDEARIVLNDKYSTILRCHKKNHQYLYADAYSKVFYFVNITHEKKVERLKSEFLNTAAHELRTPLAGIYGYSELLLNFDFDESRTKEFVDVIHNQSKLLTSIIDDLLDIAKIESMNSFSIDKQKANLSYVMDLACDQVRIIANNKNISIICSYQNNIETCFDAEKLRRAIVNILSNAVKYSGPETLVDVEHSLEQNGWHRITIKDQGIGMTEEQLSRLGEKFYRADTSGSTPGTGLGVSISRQIIELHGGSLSYTSTLGSGTVATISLPNKI